MEVIIFMIIIFLIYMFFQFIIVIIGDHKYKQRTPQISYKEPPHVTPSIATAIKEDQDIEYYNQLINNNPNDFEAYVKRGNINLRKFKDFTSAIKDFTSAIHINPSYIQAYSDRAIAYSLSGNFLKAIEDYDSVIALDPYHEKARTNKKVIIKLLKSGRDVRIDLDF